MHFHVDKFRMLHLVLRVMNLSEDRILNEADPKILENSLFFGF